MTSTVKNIKVGNTSYPVQDTKATPFLSSTDEAVLLSNGTYRGETVANGTIFTKPDGTLNEYVLGDSSLGVTLTAGTITYDRYQDMVYAKGNLVASSVNNATVVVSSDLGATWTTVTLDAKIGAMCVDESGNIYSYDGGNYPVKSTDGGLTWTRGTRNTYMSTPTTAVYGNGVVVMCSSSASYMVYSADGLTYSTCTGIPSSTGKSVIFDDANNVFIFHSTSSKAVYTSSNGASWSLVGTTPVSSDVYYNTMCAGGGVLLYAIRSSSTVYKSTDSGSTWTALSTLPFAQVWKNLSYVDGTFYLFSDYGLFTSTDAGESWTFAGFTTSMSNKFPLMLSATSFYEYPKWSGTGSNSELYAGDISLSTTGSLRGVTYTKSSVDSLIPSGYLTGSSAPSTDTEAKAGQRYFDTSSNRSSVCVGTAAGTSTAYYTVVGSPTITNHVVTQSNNANYLTGPEFTWGSTSSSKWSVEFTFTQGTDTYEHYLFQIGTSYQFLAVQSATLRWSTSWNNGVDVANILENGVKYDVKVEYTGTYLNVYLTRHGVAMPSTPLIHKQETRSWTGQLRFAGVNNASRFTGSMDMASFVIKSNGVEVWRGADATPIEYQWKQLANKDEAGIPVLLSTTDPSTTTAGLLGQRLLNTVSGSSFVCNGVYVPEEHIPNYTVHGSPTISSDYVASNFSSSNRVVGPTFSWASNASDSWAVEFYFTTGSVSTNNVIWGIGSSDNRAFIYNNNLVLNFVAYGISYTDSTYRTSISSNTAYKCKFVYTGSEIQMYLALSSEDYPSTPTLSKTANSTIASNTLYIGLTNTSSEYFRGSVDLKNFRIYSNDALVWEAVTTVEEVPAVWTELHDSSVVQTMPASPIAGKIYFVTGS